jgi:heat shock protein HslJ
MSRFEPPADPEGDRLVIEVGGERVDPDAPRTVRFEGVRVAERVGVNRFMGSFTMDGDLLELFLQRVG